jgi:Flp pilus assembly protein TadG
MRLSTARCARGMRLSTARCARGSVAQGTRLGTARRAERGSMAVEFVVVAPAFALLLLLVSAGGQWVSLTGQVGGAARDAARAASVARSPADAVAQAQLAAGQDLSGLCAGGPGGHPQVTVTPVSGGQGAAFATASEIEVRVACDVRLSAFALVGFVAQQTFTATGVAPLDTFVCRSGAC